VRRVTNLSRVQGFGVDIGGSGIKGCVVDLDKGELVGERVRIPTPQPALPDPVYGVVADIVGQFGWEGRIGVTYPGVMKHGVAFTAANMDSSWIGTDMAAGLEAVIPGTVQTLNDADAAGIAEMAYGAGRGERGLVLMLTFGCSSTASSSPTPSSGTSRSTAPTGRRPPPPPPASARTSATPPGPSGSTATWTPWRRACGPT
jgi:hypothetical protein